MSAAPLWVRDLDGTLVEVAHLGAAPDSVEPGEPFTSPFALVVPVAIGYVDRDEECPTVAIGLYPDDLPHVPRLAWMLAAMNAASLYLAEGLA